MVNRIRADFAGSRRIEAPDRERFNVGLLIPTSGIAGIWGPSALACATLAAETWNDAGGHLGREVHLTVVDAADESTTLEDEIGQLCDAGTVEAFVGMHTSSVRDRIAGTLVGALPFVYAPMYEGGALPAGVFAIGDTPETYLVPALQHLAARYRARRWYLLGHDYCWPRRSHALAKTALAAAGAQVVGERYLAFDELPLDEILSGLRRSRADAVLVSLIGQGAIDFHRAFGHDALASRMIRLACAMEENALLAIGADATDELFVSASYFGSLQTDANGAFKERYWRRFGERGPVLNALGQGGYEGIAFLRGLLNRQPGCRSPVRFDSVRDTRWSSNAAKTTRTYLAQADGMALRVVEGF